MSGLARSQPRWGVWLFLLIAAGLLIVAALAGIVAYQFRYSDHVYEGVQVAGISLGGQTLDEAVSAIKEGLTPYPGAPIIVRYGDRSWSLAPADLGVSVDARATATAAYAVGRGGKQSASVWEDLLADLVTQLTALQFGRRITPILQYDENKLALALKDIAGDVDLPPREGTLTISGLDVRGTPGYSGRRVDLDATRAAITEVLRAGRGGTVELVVEERLPAVVSVGSAVAKAKALLGKPLMLIAEGLDGPQRLAVDQATLREWLTFSPTRSPDGVVELAVQLDRDQIVSYVQEIAKRLDQPALDAALDFDPQTKQVIVLKPSRTGQKLEIEASADAIEATLAGDQREIKLPVTIVQPKVDSNKIGEMGIVDLVSSGTTYFKGSSADRVHNIATAAEKFRGVVIPPDGEFSFNEHVGEITAANGFVEGLVIGAERTAVGIGGGVCQVSTTVFRAAFNGGFPILERYAHGYVVSWYGKPGLDATVFTPSVDFRFRNDTGHYLLIKPEVDTQKSTITFYFFGTPQDRTVEANDPVITNVRKPAPPIYEENPELPKGVIKQVDWAKDGMDVVVKRRITYGNGKVVEQKFVSKYQPWRAIFQYGPETALPAGATGG